MPAEVNAALLRSEGLVKALRKWRGASQLDLAQKAGLGQGYLSDIESGRRRGSPETLRAIAAALDVDPARIVANDEEGQ